ncbi:hypothetical protein [Thiohalorhabdus sp.]|uniref:hypothetical protein n=1 Tax=Thiohalorhabdus sp. TaxID=3094134 RepID=UPI002FC39E9A
MRTLFAFLIAPAAGLAVFTLVWAAPEIQLARGGPKIALAVDHITPVWLVPAYILLLVMSVPLFRELRTVFGWTGPSTTIGALLIYGLTAAGLGVALGGLGTLLPGWSQWLGLVSASLVHAAVFLSFRPGVRKYYFL